MAFDPDAYLADKATEFDPDAYLADKTDSVPTLPTQVITPSEGGGQDLLFYKSGLTQPQREEANAPLREAMQVPAVSPEAIDQVLQALNTTDEQGPAQQGIDEKVSQAISSMTTGEGVASAPLYMFPPTAAGVTAENVEQIPSEVGQAAQQFSEGDVQQGAGTTTEALLNALSAAGVAHGGVPFVPETVPPPPIGTPLVGKPLVGPPGTTASDFAAQAQPPPVQLPVSQEGVPPLIQPGDEPYAGVTPQMGTQEAPIGAANRIASAREQVGLTEAPPSGIGQSWHESVAQGNALIDKGANAYKVVSDFQKTGDISGEKMSVARAWLERLQRANQEARGALEQDPTNPVLQSKALDAETAESAYWQGYQPMKTEWSKIGTGMQEQRGITDSDLLNQKTAEQVMRENIERELTDSDKVRAAKAVSDTRGANARSDAAFDKAIGEATRKAKGPPRSLEQLKNDLAAKLKELTPC